MHIENSNGKTCESLHVILWPSQKFTLHKKINLKYSKINCHIKAVPRPKKKKRIWKNPNFSTYSAFSSLWLFLFSLSLSLLKHKYELYKFTQITLHATSTSRFSFSSMKLHILPFSNIKCIINFMM